MVLLANIASKSLRTPTSPIMPTIVDTNPYHPIILPAVIRLKQQNLSMRIMMGLVAEIMFWELIGSIHYSYGTGLKRTWTPTFDKNRTKYKKRMVMLEEGEEGEILHHINSSWPKNTRIHHLGVVVWIFLH
jgi:hypothetical protein